MLLNKAFNLPFKQSEVDFIIPNLTEDLQLYVDPFLFYKSRNPEFQAVHALLQRFFEIAIDKVKEGDERVARRMMSFPEVKETMLGLSTGSHKGRGLGPSTGEDRSRGDVIYREIVSNEDILKRGIQHLAEMQLLIEGVGFDMVSDMITNIAKPFFVAYTQRQCHLHNIPIEKGLNLEHIFDWEELEWDDQPIDLPASPSTGAPILLVPKTVVRRFAEIDYKDFWNSTYRYILRDIEVQKSLQTLGREPKITWKEINEKYGFSKSAVVQVLHEDPDLKRTYFTQKEQEIPNDAFPIDLNVVEGTDKEVTPVADYITELRAIEPGSTDAKRYEALIVRILSRLFAPPLVDPHSQVMTTDRREIIDITFYNGAQAGFWGDIKQKHGGVIVIFELKNMTDLANEEYFQIAARLDNIKGKFGILIARDKDNLDEQRAYRRLHSERKVILTVTDEDIIQMLRYTESGLLATQHLQRMYRTFIEGA